MNRLKKEEQQKYTEKIKNMTVEEKKNFDFLLNLQDSFKSLIDELHVKLFPEEFDYFYDSNVDANRRRLGENPMSEDYIQRMNKKREKLGFLPLTKNGYAQDSKETFEFCKKLIIAEIEYSKMIKEEF